jgi:hypothetical protein
MILTIVELNLDLFRIVIMITYEKTRNLGDVVDYVDFLFSVLLIIFEITDVDTPG